VPYDIQDKLQAIPARFGIAFALRLSTLCHFLTTLLLATLGILLGLGWPYWLGWLVTAGLLVYEHSLVRPDDLSSVDVAFFNINSYISLTLLVSILGALYL
jgi:4-hydroxybenzoate polyprenyltransferase